MTSSASKNNCKVSITNRREVNLSYTWRLDKFKNRPEEKGENIESPSFSSGLDYNDEWSLLCYPRGKSDEEGDAVAILLWLRASRRPIDARFKVSIYDETGKERNLKSSSKNYEFVPGAGKGFNKFMNRDELLEFLNLSGGDLLLYCTVTIIEEAFIHEFEPKPHVSVSLSNQLGKFFEQQEFGDITFVISGAKLQAHKAILAARSPVFAEMFLRGKMSHEEHEMPLSGVQLEAFKELLYFLYTDRAPNMYSMSPYLLLLSEQYKVRGLKELCEREILGNLEAETAAQFLCVADQSKSWGLKGRIIKFINSNLHEVLETRGFRMMQSKYPEMVVELLRATQTSPRKRKIEINRF